MKMIYITDSSTEIDTGKPLQSHAIFALYSFSYHRLWIGFHWHWIKYVVLFFLCFTDRTLISTSFHLMIGQSARTLQTCIIELNWIVYQKILQILPILLAFWLSDFTDKEPACSKSFRIYRKYLAFTLCEFISLELLNSQQLFPIIWRMFLSSIADF